MNASISKGDTANAVETAIERAKSDERKTWAEILDSSSLRIGKNEAPRRPDAPIAPDRAITKHGRVRP